MSLITIKKLILNVFQIAWKFYQRAPSTNDLHIKITNNLLTAAKDASTIRTRPNTIRTTFRETKSVPFECRVWVPSAECAFWKRQRFHCQVPPSQSLRFRRFRWATVVTPDGIRYHLSSTAGRPIFERIRRPPAGMSGWFHPLRNSQSDVCWAFPSHKFRGQHRK